MKILQVVSNAYRCTVEEQDDPAIWISAAMAAAGADLALLLRGAAVSYALRGQDASGLAFGDVAQTRPPRLDRDVERLVSRGIAVYAVRDDLERRGIDADRLVDGVELVSAASLSSLLEDHDQVWNW